MKPAPQESLSAIRENFDGGRKKLSQRTSRILIWELQNSCIEFLDHSSVGILKFLCRRIFFPTYAFPKWSKKFGEKEKKILKKKFFSMPENFQK